MENKLEITLFSIPIPVSLTPTLYLTQYVKNMTGETDMTDITTIPVYEQTVIDLTSNYRWWRQLTVHLYIL